MNKDITERIGVHKASLFFLENFNWIEREQSISDYGIDMQIEIKEDGKATGVLIAIQVKSGDSYCKIKNNSLIYKGELRHLEYWINHSLPVLLVLYHPSEEKLYWQSISPTTGTIQVNEKNWSTKIPIYQQLNQLTQKEDIINCCFNTNDYQVINKNNDWVAGENRYELKVIITYQEKYIIKKVIKNIYNNVMSNNDAIDTLTIWCYSKKIEVDKGLPFCTARWRSEYFKDRLNVSQPNDFIGDIEIEWASLSTKYANHFLFDNPKPISNYLYINICDTMVNYCKSIMKRLEEKKFNLPKKNLKDIKKNLFIKNLGEENYILSTDLIKLKTYRNDIKDLLLDDILENLITQNRSESLREFLEEYNQNIEKYDNQKEVILTKYPEECNLENS